MNNDFIVKQDMICPISKQHCDDECCTVGSQCNISGNKIKNMKEATKEKMYNWLKENYILPEMSEATCQIIASHVNYYYIEPAKVYAKQEAIKYLSWYIQSGYEAENIEGTIFTEGHNPEKKFSADELYQIFFELKIEL